MTSTEEKDKWSGLSFAWLNIKITLMIQNTSEGKENVLLKTLGRKSANSNTLLSHSVTWEKLTVLVQCSVLSDQRRGTHRPKASAKAEQFSSLLLQPDILFLSLMFYFILSSQPCKYTPRNYSLYLSYGLSSDGGNPRSRSPPKSNQPLFGLKPVCSGRLDGNPFIRF